MPTTDARSPLWIGHVALLVPDLSRAKSFLLSIGLREAGPASEVGALATRGGTHLPGRRRVDSAARAPFDPTVDDHVEARANHAWQGVTVSEMRQSPFHEFFTVREPNGCDILVNSSHPMGLAV